METLDSLKLKGSKGGIITHVKEMTEKIPVKINVKKLQSGASKIEID